MPRRKITPEELVDAEIERLKKTDAVKLAQKEQRLLYRKRKYTDLCALIESVYAE